MSGIRIQHPTKRSTTFTLVDGSRPYREPWTCPPPPEGCASTHQFKTYHLRLDETGAVIVSHEILAYLKRISGQPFEVSNEVAKPPTQYVRPPLLVIRVRPVALKGAE